MPENNELHLIPTSCAGATSQPGERPPLLDNPIPVVTVLDGQGDPIKVNGCGFLTADGKCGASENLPACLYTRRNVENDKLITNSPVETALVPTVTLTPVEMNDVFTALSVTNNTVDLEHLENAAQAKALIGLVIQDYSKRLSDLGLKNFGIEQGPFFSKKIVPPSYDKKHLEKPRVLANGTSTQFAFEFNYKYELSNINVSFNSSELSFSFNNNGEINKINLTLGDSDATTENAFDILSRLGLENSILYQYLKMQIPTEIPAGRKLINKKELIIEIGDTFTSLVRSHYKNSDKTGGHYYQNLAYNSNINKFINQNATVMEPILSLEQFVMLIANIFQILPPIE